MRKLLIAALLWVGLVQPGWSLTVEERLLEALQSQGYTVIEKGYTFLGRLRVVAENGEIHREIVVNPGTGEVLRDYAVYISDLPPPPQAPLVADGSTRSGGSPDKTAALARTGQDKGHGTVTGTAGIAAMALEPGSSTLGSAEVQVDTSQGGGDVAVESTLLPLMTGTP